MSFHVLLGVGLYASWLGISVTRETWRAQVWGFGLWCGSIVLGIGLAAIQYLPTLAQVPIAMITVIRGTQPSVPVPLKGLSSWIVPNLNGNLALHMPYWGRGIITRLYFMPEAFPSFWRSVRWVGCVRLGGAEMCSFSPGWRSSWRGSFTVCRHLPG
jgi:hypothetical protein